jgi:hypothetical protein
MAGDDLHLAMGMSAHAEPSGILLEIKHAPLAGVTSGRFMEQEVRLLLSEAQANALSEELARRAWEARQLRTKPIEDQGKVP